MNSFIDGSAFCPGAPKRVHLDSEKHLRVSTSSHKCHSHVWCVDTATGKTLKKTECAFRRSADRQLKIKLRVQTASEANRLKVCTVPEKCMLNATRRRILLPSAENKRNNCSSWWILLHWSRPAHFSVVFCLHTAGGPVKCL